MGIIIKYISFSFIPMPVINKKEIPDSWHCLPAMTKKMAG